MTVANEKRRPIPPPLFIFAWSAYLGISLIRTGIGLRLAFSSCDLFSGERELNKRELLRGPGMTQLPSIELLSNYGQFKGNKFSKIIEFGVDTSSSAILLEGTTIFYQAAGEEQHFIKTYGMVNRTDSITDDVGSLSFWIEKDETRCQLNLFATPAVFDDIYSTLCTLKENYQYSFFVATKSDTLVERNNTIKSYSLSFVEIE
jgi:hypothetical protein